MKLPRPSKPERVNFKVSKCFGNLAGFQKNKNTLAKVSSLAAILKKQLISAKFQVLCIFTLTSVLANQFFIKVKKAVLKFDLAFSF